LKGPLPLLDDPDHATIISSLRNRVPKILSLKTNPPRAIIVVTAHWQTRQPAISSAPKHKLYYDYGGFPPQTYNLSYPAPGSPEIAKDIANALAKEGLKSDLDDERGWDHGVFVPMLLVHPKADIPILQVSVLESEDPEDHTRLGRALLSLRKQNIAIVGSGFASFHNLQIMFRLQDGDPSFSSRVHSHSKEWNSALVSALKEEDPAQRAQNIAQWRNFPHANEMHPPRAGEHFMPLIVCSGAAAEGESTRTYKDNYLGVDIHTFYWGADHVE
jgi:aromatic ring-opening dioxygenase catalytic subunit (LigB family)